MTYNDVVILQNDEASLALAKSINIPCVNEISERHKLYLAYIDKQLYLCSNTDTSVVKISVDFVSSKLDYRRHQLSLKSEPLLRAVGCSQKETKSVLDATAGLGRDAFLMANYNCKVTMIEESVVVAAMLEDGLKRASLEDDVLGIVNNMRLVKQSSIEYLSSSSSSYDAVYLDPMFPLRTKSAKVRKEMQLLHQLLGSSRPEDDVTLLNMALEKSKNRVVVKRPKAANYLADKKPSYSLNTKAMRFDVYVI